MDQIGFSWIGRKHKIVTFNRVHKKSSQVRKIDNYLREWISKTLVKKEVRKNIKHVYLVVHPINPCPQSDTKAASNPHNDTTTSVDFGLNTSPTLTYAAQNFDSTKTSHLSDFTNLPLGTSVLVQVRNSSTGNNHNFDTRKCTYKSVSNYIISM